MIGMSKLVRPSAGWKDGGRRATRRRVVPAAAFAMFFLFLAAPQDAVSQEGNAQRVTITGVVVDAHTGGPIAEVQVVVRGAGLRPDGGLRIVTDADGQFQLSDIAVGEYRLQLSHDDYNPASGEFTVMRAGSFRTTLQPLTQGSGELMTGIIGIVTERESGSLLSGVGVSMGDGRQGVLSDLRGEFVLERLTGGQHVVEFSMIGYTPRADTIRVVPGRVTNVEVSLSVDPVQLDPIEVTVERREIVLQRRGFYHRQKTGFGKFIDREEIEMRGPSEMTDLFSGMAGVELYPDPLNQLERWIVLRSGRHMTMEPRTLADDDPGPGTPTDIYQRCFPRIYIDGIIAHRGGDEPARLDTFVDPGVVAGVEVYASVSGLPPEYQGHGSFCGTILIWTRR